MNVIVIYIVYDICNHMHSYWLVSVKFPRRGRIQIWTVECLSQILNLTPKGDQSWRGPGFIDP